MKQRRSTFSRAVYKVLEDLEDVSNLDRVGLWARLKQWDGWWHYVTWKVDVQTISDEAFARVLAAKFAKNGEIDPKAFFAAYSSKKEKLKAKYSVPKQPEIPGDLWELLIAAKGKRSSRPTEKQ